MTQTLTSLRNGWMGYLQSTNPGLLLTQLTIPGTHDTGTWKLSELNSGRCQEIELIAQLENGIRFIDIRLVPETNNGNNDLMIYHGDKSVSQRCDVWFSEVVATCLDFLQKNPTETIIMSIKNEWGVKNVPEATFTTALNPFINTSEQAVPGKSLFYTKNTVPDLKTSSGQIVLFRRYTGDTIGIDAVTDWPDDEQTKVPTSGTVPMMIQDIFKMKYSDQGDIKWSQHIHPFLKAAIASPDQTDVWWVNFTSTSGGGYPRIFANEINPLFQAWVDSITESQNLKTYRGGTIPMDFPNPRLIDGLIMLNIPNTSTVVQQNRNYRIELSNNKAYIGQAYKPGSWNYVQCYMDNNYNYQEGHSLIKVSGKNTAEIHFGDTVRIMSSQFSNDAFVYIQSYGESKDSGGINLFYDNIDGKYEKNAKSVEWIVEWSPNNPLPSRLGCLETGDIIRLRSASRKDCYLLAATDQYLAVEPLSYNSNKAVEGGFDWVLV